MYTGNQYILLFFMYGLAFFTMGIAAFLQNNDENSSFPLLKSINYLGLFGIIHGITEWIIMLRISEMYPQYHDNLLVLGTFTNSISFVFLWIFGAKLLQKQGKTKLFFKGIPWFIFIIWLLAFISYYFIYRTTSLHWILMEDIMSRYFLGLPGALTCAFALYKNAKEVEDISINKTSLKLKSMAICFGLYGILAGLVVTNRNFFPANIINRGNFLSIFGFPVELGRGILAVAITVLFIGVIKVFQLDTNKKIERLTKHQIVNDERKKMGQELHDVMIQNLFATGLQVENVMDMETNPKSIKELQHIRQNLNNIILQVRDFIKQVSDSRNQIEDLKIEIITLVNNFQKNCKIPIDLQYNITEVTLGLLSQDKITQIYYIVQEALCNAIKHAEATKLTIQVSTTLSGVIATITDNGKGFNPQKIPKDGGYGLTSMKERAFKINGMLDIESSSRGTIVSITIPWEESENGKKEY